MGCDVSDQLLELCPRPRRQVGKTVPPRPSLTRIAMPKPPTGVAAPAVVAAGHDADAAGFKDVILAGSHKSNGMVSFTAVINATDVEAIRAHVITEANAG